MFLVSLVLKAWSLNCWTDKEVSCCSVFYCRGTEDKQSVYHYESVVIVQLLYLSDFATPWTAAGQASLFFTIGCGEMDNLKEWLEGV